MMIPQTLLVAFLAAQSNAFAFIESTRSHSKRNTAMSCAPKSSQSSIRSRNSPSSTFFPSALGMFDILNDMEASISRSYTPRLAPQIYGTAQSFVPIRGSILIDAKETPTSYEIVAEIPGVDKEDIKLSLKQNELTISAEKKALRTEEGENFKRSERYTGSVSRTIVLPEDAAGPESLEASYENGLLYLTVPKHKPEEEKVHVIEIKERVKSVAASSAGPALEGSPDQLTVDARPEESKVGMEIGVAGDALDGEEDIIEL